MPKDFHTRLRLTLARLVPRPLEGNYADVAAVVMPLLTRRREPHLLLTRRTRHVATHKGQISFPGGARDVTDRSLVETALREMQEEVGIGAEQVDIVGEFHEYLAITGHRVKPFIGVLPEDITYRPSLREVAYVLEVPLRFFALSPPEVRRQERAGRLVEVFYYDYQGEIIWGLTARMIRDFIDYLCSEKLMPTRS